LRRKLVANEWNGCVRIYDWIGWFVRLQWFSYLGMAFRLLHVDTTLKFWKSVYFVGHLSLLLFYAIGISVFKPLTKLVFPRNHQE
jgi:hypothetical protein